MPARTDWASCCDRILEDARILRQEFDTLNKAFQQTSYWQQAHNFPNAHDGYLMSCMSKVDFMSACFLPNVRQTPRMLKFLDTYLYPTRSEEHKVLIQMFRHTLMHTGERRFLVSRDRSSVYTWSLRSGDTSRFETHYRVTDVDPAYQDQILALFSWIYPDAPLPRTKCFHLVLPRFTEDIERVAQSFVADAQTSPTLQTQICDTYRVAALQMVR